MSKWERAAAYEPYPDIHSPQLVRSVGMFHSQLFHIRIADIRHSLILYTVVSCLLTHSSRANPHSLRLTQCARTHPCRSRNNCFSGLCHVSPAVPQVSSVPPPACRTFLYNSNLFSPSTYQLIIQESVDHLLIVEY